jgi:hypothetical protein
MAKKDQNRDFWSLWNDPFIYLIFSIFGTAVYVDSLKEEGLVNLTLDMLRINLDEKQRIGILLYNVLPVVSAIAVW